ncbi:hypothetical protein [Sandaracinus amylolyticus]|uniref:hypothetical protein n=1 Tax=Sandaracinus amylolyticus TaxID=927083 RepID=UPI001F28A7A5|nr:hypothetical protein [Sandaracinus amylolyticus]UJR85307.1 Hypothetical protein I5071_73870 [Sandaracinus amylolyticus]
MIVLAGCAETGREYVEVPLFVAGGESSFSSEGWTLTLTRADVAFGPLYLCSTESASPEHCESAILELTSAVTIDGVDPSLQSVGNTFGITGTARSGMWDYGISWLPTETRARPLEGAVDGESSARFVAQVTHEDGRAFEVQADLAIAPSTRGVIVVRGRRVEEHEITSSDDALTVRVDPIAWWQRVDLDRLAARAAEGEDPVVLTPDDADYEALVLAMTAGELPALSWGAPE